MPKSPQLNPTPPADAEVLLPSLFIRHKRQLRAVLLEAEPWFPASDLFRLIHHPLLSERVRRNLDDDQWQRAWMRNSNGEFEEEFLISESGAYAVLMFYFHPENRAIRRWITQQVIPRLRDEGRLKGQRPRRDVIPWREHELEVLHWQGRTWLDVSECHRLLQRPERVIG
ncbi:BRO-N domain-containing protein [Metapseudomonas furukawaii]|uniref:BRO-N domain-containing protein n=1 Tax=Metapseudomonas furukawaii TaxID=1149133 RepID=UPI004045C52B